MLVFKNRHLGSQKGDLRFEEMKTFASIIFAYYVFYNSIKDFSWNLECNKAKVWRDCEFLKVDFIFSFSFSLELDCV